MTTPAFGTFFLPGPTEVHAEVLAAMLRPMMPHRGAAFEALFARCVRGLQTVFRTTRPVYVSSSSATGLMEGAVRAAPPGPILALVNGAFSERFARIATACGRETELMQVPLGASFDLGAVRAQLAARAWAAITVVHSETSTGVLTDVHALTVLAHEFDVPCLVDSVTGVGGTPVEADGWALDFVLTGSQKALALPPGLAFGVASERFIAQAKSGVARGVYFDLVEFESYGAKHQTPNTPALSLLYALDAQLPRIAAEGIEGRWARHAAMADATHAWVAALAQRTGRERHAVNQLTDDAPDLLRYHDDRHAAQADGAKTWALLHDLPAEQAQVLLMAYVEGKSQREIAAELELPVGTVKSRLRLGFTRVRDRLEPSQARRA